MEEERIEVVKAWPEPKSIRVIQIFLGFANFYRRFIQGFSKIAAPLTSMLKTTAGTPPRAADNSSFLTSEAKLAFLRLRQAFTEAPILHHFDPERYIRIETDASGYAIGGILSQLTPDSGQWYPVAFFSRKMIPAETWYKTHDQELLAIVEAFKTWRHYLEDYKFEVFVLIHHNNLCRFMDPRASAPGKSGGPRNSLDTIFESIIAKAKLIHLLILCHVFSREFRAMKKSSKSRIPKFFIGYNPHWLMPA